MEQGIELNAALVIEQQPLAQSHLKYSLRNLGFKQVDFADRAYLATKAINNKYYDLILCSSDLHSGADGYQLFEQLVAEKRILPSNCFVFLSSEASVALSQSVLELKPDDFILKPYSASEIEQRLGRILNKKLALRKVFKEIDRNDFVGASEQLHLYVKEEGSDALTPYVLKLKGELLVLLKQWPIGKRFFNRVCEMQPFPWAQIGQVNCLIELGELDEAEKKLEFMLRSPMTKLQSLDLLTRICKQRSDFEQASHYVKQAIDIAPRNLTRLNDMVQISRLLHDFKSQFSASNSLVRQLRNSVHDKPDHYLSAIRSNIDYGLTSLNEEEVGRLAQQSQGMLKNLRKLFPGEPLNDQIDVAQARIYNLRNEKDKAKSIMFRWLDKIDRHQNYINNLEDGLDQAKALHELGFFDESERVFNDLSIYCQLTKSDLVTSQYISEERQLRIDIKESPKELNNKAVGFFKHGNYAHALDSFELAFKLMPKSPAIALNLMQSAIESNLINFDRDKLMGTVEKCKKAISVSKLNSEQLNRYDKLNEMLEVKLA